MAHHTVAHPDPVPGCFGCKALGIGYQGLRSREGSDPVRKVAVTGDDHGRVVGQHIEHWDGRQDASVMAPTTVVKMHTTEENG